MKPSRNDPCHCGSGRKYKQCHLKTDQVRAREERSLKSGSEWVSFHGRAMRESVYAAAPTAAAADTFFDTPPEAPLADAGFEQHVLYDVAVEGAPVILNGDLGDEKPEDRDTLRELLAETFPTLLEVVDCKRGKGVRLKDRLTDRTLFVSETKLADVLEPMELVLGRLFVFRERNKLHDGWEKVGFRGRKAVIRGFEAAIADVEEDDRAAWLKREAPALYRAARASAPATAT